MRKRRRPSVAAAIITLVLCVGSGAVVEAQPPIRIGATLSQTGVYAVPAQNQLRGYQLCVKHVNDRGGVLGRKLELVIHDDRSDPATAVSLYERLITQDTMDLVLGPYSSPLSEAVADVSEKYRMPMVAPVAAATSIYRKERIVWPEELAPGKPRFPTPPWCQR